MAQIKKYKVGAVQTKKDKSGVTVKLGNYSKNEKYKTTTQIIVRNHEGKVLADVTDGFLQVVNPREREGLTEEQLARIPEYIRNELFVVISEE